jgi:hypothetical protein
MKYRDKVIKPGRRKSQMENVLPSAYENDATSKVIHLRERIRALAGIVAVVRERLNDAPDPGSDDSSSVLAKKSGPSDGDLGPRGGADRKEK